MLAQLTPRATPTARRLRSTVLSGEEWLAAWHELPARVREVYYHPHFASTCGRWEGARAQCLLVEGSRDRRLLYPYLRHPILGYESVAGPCCDVQTPYGYGGPLFLGDWDLDDQRRALDAVADHLRHTGPIAEFVRCHTEWLDAAALEYCGYRTRLVRTNVEYDLPEGAVAGLGSDWDNGARYQLKQAHRCGLRYRVSRAANDLAAFEKLYALTAERVNMARACRFDHDYYRGLLELDPVQAKLILVETAEHRPAAGAILFLGGTLAHFHLAGSDFALQSLRGNVLLYWAAAREAAATGCQRIVWGGGTTNDPQDSLFLFKAQYGRRRTPVHIATRVLDGDRYSAICDEWSRRHPEKAKTKLFLKYRA